MRQAYLLLIVLVVFSFSTSAQITVDPPFPTADQAVTVTLNTAGTGLEDYTGEIYAHTGLTIGGNQWQNVIGDWGNNQNQPKLTNMGGGIYELEITPSIRDFYSAEATDLITELCMVFRSSDGSLQTSPDIFYDVYESQSLNVLITAPAIRPLIVELNDEIQVEGNSVAADSTYVYVDDNTIYADTGDSFTASFTANEYGKFWVKAVAMDDTEMVADSFYYFVRSAPEVEDLPDGIHDGINYIDDNTVVLCLYAPEKEYIFAIGDFSDWEVGDNNYMKQTPDGNRFWIELSGLTPNQPYIFQYFIDGEIRVGDIYADQVSDPWNDKWIPSDIYPDLPAYPDGKTDGIATVFETGQEAYQWEVADFEAPKVTDMVVYEMLVRDFLEKHDFETIVDTLDYLERLGINVLELMPTSEFEGNSSWGYNPNYYFAVDKYYGPKNTLKKLVDECHKRGIAVVGDLVLNHAYNTCPLVQMYWNSQENRPAANNPWFNETSNFTNPSAQWGNDFNHESTATQNLVDSINSYWMSEYKFDGFRFDFTKGFGNNIKGPDDEWGSKYDADRIALLKRMADEMWERNPDAYVIFEHLSDNSEEKELANYGILMWGNMNYTYNEGTMGYNESGKSDFSWISYKKRGWNNPNVVGYMESHDEERLMFKNITYGNSSGDYNIKDTLTALTRQELAAAFFFTIPGPKMIWQFGERGYDYSIDYNGRLGEKPPKWDYMDSWNRRHLFYVYQALIDLKKNETAFETDDFDMNLYSATKRIRLNSEEMSVVVLGNFNVVVDDIEANFHFPGTWYEYFTGEQLNVVEESMPIALEPGEYRIYTSVKLDTPDFVGIDDNEIDDIVSDVILYPNPATSTLHLDLLFEQSTEVEISIYDIQGRKLTDLYNGRLSAGFRIMQKDISGFDKGIYFVTIRTEGRQITKKLLVN